MVRRALLIGINDYPKFPLSGCIEDINLMGKALERNGDGSKNFEILKKENPHRFEEVEKAIDLLLRDDSEIALFYFSGHGLQKDGHASMVFPGEDGIYQEVPLTRLMEKINNSKAANKIVILDSCFSGFVGRVEGQDESFLGQGVSIMTACREDETALECGGHGLFTELLYSGLKGGAADFCGNITIGSLYAYIDRSLGGWYQRPIFKTNITAFTPIKKVTPEVPLSTIRQLTNLFENPNNELGLDPSFEFTNTPHCKHTIIKPYAKPENVEKFKILQALTGIGFVEPCSEDHMYFEAMKSGKCKLTELGKYYWRLVSSDRI